MKYWVYKESRILGPFEKEAVSGFPGLDAATLVCPGDPDGGTWTPAGELADLRGLSFAEYPKTGGVYEFPSAMGLLDRLQIDAAGLVGDDEFPGALAEDLFQDADLKKSFSDVLSARGPSDDLETLYRRISELEAGQTDLTRRLAEKDLELSRRGAAPPPESLAPALPEIPAPPTTERYREEVPPPPAVEERPTDFDKPKSFKVVPTVKSFKVVPAPEAVPTTAVPMSAVPTPEVVIQPAATPIPEPAPIAAVTPAPISVFPTPVPVPFPTPAPESERPTSGPPLSERPTLGPPLLVALDPLSIRAPMPTPVPPPPITLSTDAPVTDLAVNDRPDVGRSDAGGAAAPATDAALARFAKPAPTTDAPKKSLRNNKTFLLVGVVVVLLLLAVGLVLMRQPKDDLKQMTNLDDGKAPIGVPNLNEENAFEPRPAKPRAAAPEPPAASVSHEAAIAMVKDFPLDGGRGTVGRWLQYSYAASPDAGTEEWNASTTEEKTVLVEYRLVPGPKGGNAALYLFELRLLPGRADAERELVVGKNLEARRMLAGGPPQAASDQSLTPKTRKTPAAKKAKRAAKGPAPEPKEVPLLLLPDSGELRPPSEDDGAFGSDTINSGI